ncbi:methionine--tRNA ligase [Candidatus Marsarchaeota archaeon]|nr:methionine--tRNA ligase [Candidatus Marsarchaeota archaeon]
MRKNNNSVKNNKVLITAALPYINNIPHLGHIVGSHLPADIFARYCRVKGYPTLFVGGTDEHGSTSEIAASELGIPIEQFCLALHNQHKKIYEWFDISYDNFSRTTSKLHEQTVIEFFNKINKNGFISKKVMKQLYSPKEERFLPDRYVVGTCPKCGYENAIGDQCEKCTSLLDAIELINPRSAITNDPVEIRESEQLFFRLDRLSNELRLWVENQKEWRIQVHNTAIGFINEGLKERCITRDLKFGIKVPIKEFNDKVFYVWFDALIGYISFTKEIEPDRWKDFWESDQAKVYNFLGKDNIPFHTIFWPGLIIANNGFNLPYNVIGLQFLNYEGAKFSKSQKNGVFCEGILESGINSDEVRGALIPLIPETGDTDFEWKNFQTLINSDLLGNFGNFINRTISFIDAKLDGKVLKPDKLSESEKSIINTVKEKSQKIEELLEKIEIRLAFREFLLLSSECNKYIHNSEPWLSIKKDTQKASNTMYICTCLCKTLAVFSSPFLPKSAKLI